MPAAQIDWILSCEGVPSHDFLEGLDEPDPGDSAVSPAEDFADATSRGYFVTWEGLIRLEQGLSLSAAEKKAVHSLFPASSGRRVLYVDGLPRPRRSWHETLKRIAEALLLDKVDTVDPGDPSQIEAWQTLERALREAGKGLRLPPGAASPLDVLQPPTRWRLELHSCLITLCGIGQNPMLTLTDPDERRSRVRDLLHELADHADCVQALTLDTLLARLLMPRREKRILEQALRRRLALGSPGDPLAEPLAAYQCHRARRTGAS